MSGDRFAVYEQFNQEELRPFARMKHRIHSLPDHLFPGRGLPDRLARSLAERRVVHIKELLEAFELFSVVRRRLRRSTVVDLCAGHGLAGLIFALCEPEVTRVLLVDERQPETFPRILEAFVAIAPWVADKVEYRAVPLTPDLDLPHGASTVLVHACGSLTDRGLELAVTTGGPVAAMPCCYGKADKPRVMSLRKTLGRPLAIDVDRTYRLDAAGYKVDWDAIPDAITPMNRVIVGWQRA